MQARLGHASIGMTLDIYSHVLAGMQHDAAAQVESLLWSHGEVDHTAKEIARLRNARITDCGY